MKKWLGAAMALTLMLTVAACGGGNEGSSGGSGSKAIASDEANATQVKLIASNFKFDQEVYTVKKDEPIEFILENEEGFHGVEIVGLNIKLSAGKAQQFKITEPGEYRIECSIMCGAGHKDMVSTLVVES